MLKKIENVIIKKNIFYKFIGSIKFKFKIVFYKILLIINDQ